MAEDDTELMYDEEVGVVEGEDHEQPPKSKSETLLRGIMEKHPRGGLPFLYRQIGSQGFSPHPVWWRLFLHWVHEELPPLIPQSRSENWWDGILYRNHYPLKWWFWPVRAMLGAPAVALEKPPNIYKGNN